ncbi:RNase J family beta-CASP ribonuclease [Candidatus Pacearchaeota archaeon]|nr:MAG: RNase J family beta-CASP ribonuclease [Candidatus Pacearchaeota archaeon]
MKIHAIGGYDEVGKNMTALEIGEDVIIFDCGLYLPAIVGVEENERIPTERGMRALGALPDDLYLDKRGLRKKVRAILISHAHLDHVGGAPFLAQRYDAPVLSTPYTIEILKALLKDAQISIPNKLIGVNLNSSYVIKGKSGEYKVEFLNMTHSVIQSSCIAVHTPEGVVLYANDYKFDNTPVLGDKPNYARLKELSKKGVTAFIVDCLYAPDDRKTPSEKIARGLLEDVLFTTDNHNSALVITTFSSHIARLKTITEFSKRLGREVVFVGRSIGKYLKAARNLGLANFSRGLKIASFRREIERALKRVEKNRNKYVVVCTGHQGEPGSILDRISRNKMPFKLRKGDHVIFSSRTIPTPVNEANRANLEKRLKKFNVRIFDNIHVSGHGGREDLRDFIRIVKAKNVIPSHGDLTKTSAGAELAQEEGYVLHESVHLMKNQSVLEVKNK